jgi:hypothetical protein
MPVHDWARVDSGIFHAFHHEWISEVGRALNQGLLPPEYYALPEQIAGGVGPDVLTLQVPEKATPRPGRSRKQPGAAVALADSPPKTRFHISNPPPWFAARKKSVVVRHVSEHRVVAVFEIVSPGNKESRSALAAFVRKAQDLLARGVHLALVDLFPPTRRDPAGIHAAVWGEDDVATFQFDPAAPLTCASYIGGAGAEAFVEPTAVGKPLPDLPLFLTLEEYVPLPLETTYQRAFAAVPQYWQQVLTQVTPVPRRRRRAR